MDVRGATKDFLHGVVNNTAEFVKENKVEIATTMVSGGAGAIKGAVTKTGLHFSKQAARATTKEAIINGAKSSAKNGFAKGVLTSIVVKVAVDPNSMVDQTKFGKSINSGVDWVANQANKGIDWLFGGGSR